MCHKKLNSKSSDDQWDRVASDDGTDHSPGVQALNSNFDVVEDKVGQGKKRKHRKLGEGSVKGLHLSSFSKLKTAKKHKVKHCFSQSSVSSSSSNED